MARIRTVKPELFKHEDLYDLESSCGLPVRLAFIGLFTCCDRDGRFKWRPRTLKLDVLPHDDIDFSRVLDALASRGFVRKYAVAGEEYGCIPSFAKHQVINNREAGSEFPGPEQGTEISVTCTREARVSDATATPLVQVQGEGKGKEGKGREEEGKGNVGALAPVGRLPDVVQEIFCYWQHVMNSPRSVLDKDRRSIIERALKSYTVEQIFTAIRGCSKSPYNMGQNYQNTKYNGLGLILRNAEKIDRFIQLDSNQAVAENETLEQRNERIIAEVMGDVKDTDANTIDMEP
jgi:hypothetical protein